MQFIYVKYIQLYPTIHNQCKVWEKCVYREVVIDQLGKPG